MQDYKSHPNWKIQYNDEHNILIMRCYGDISDDIYKTMWEEAIKLSLERNIRRFLIDQREIGRVSFSARGWVIVSLFPKIKSKLSKEVRAAVLKSSNMANSSGIMFLVKAFKKVSGYDIDFFDSDKSGIVWLSKV